jgi:hypothetical protein
MRVLVCGSRTFATEHEHDEGFASERDLWEYDVLTAVLDGLREGHDIEAVITGGAKGADRQGHDWAGFYGYERPVFHADWAKHGNAAGPIRNQQMLDEGKPDLVVAFVDKPLAESRGTVDMVSRARKAAVKTVVVEVV